MLLSVAESKGIKSDLIPRIATGFCSGIARTSGMCGAISGGIMAIGLFTGRSSPHETVADCYDRVRDLIGRFQTKYGSTDCEVLTGCDLDTDEGMQKFEAGNLLGQCVLYAEEVTKMVMEILDDNDTDDRR
ncbi:MAG: C-GCAxxG-C-C family protein [Candidatus Eisenbacteria bacterium]